MKIGIRYPSALLLFALTWAQTVSADTLLPGALIEPEWLISNGKNEDIAVIDIQEQAMFSRHHVPGSISWPFSQWRSDGAGDPPKSLLPLDLMAKRLGKQGVSAATPVVIVAMGVGPGDLSAAARVFWTLKVLGHDQVGILNGGLLSYVNEHRAPYDSGKAEARMPTVYEATPNLELLATAEWLKDATMPRLDARSQAEHLGLISGGADERPGTLVGAHHLPFDWMADGNGGRLRSTEQLKTLFKYAGLPDKAAVHFCHTGNRASLTWFVDYAILGHQSARLYDASMLEWARDPNLPIDTKLKL